MWGAITLAELVELSQRIESPTRPPWVHDFRGLDSDLFVCVCLLSLRPVSMHERQKTQPHESAGNAYKSDKERIQEATTLRQFSKVHRSK